MNKWFEKANFASYAKTALLQAQKKIDQVLDIKEDEILSSLKIQEQQQQQQQQQQSKELETQSNNEISDLRNNLNSKRNSIVESDDFFSSFLGENNESFSNSRLNIDQQKIQKQKKQTIDVDLIASTTSVSSSTITDVSKLDSSNDLLANDDYKNNKQLIDKEKQDWIQNYLDDNSQKDHEQDLSKHEQDLLSLLNDNKTKDLAIHFTTNADIDDEDVGASIDEIAIKNQNESNTDGLLNENKVEINENDDKKKVDYNEYIKIDNLSGNASSNSDEPETCASSDIEVLSLPSNNDLIINSNNNKRLSSLHSNVVIVKSPPPPLPSSSTSSLSATTTLPQAAPIMIQQLKSASSTKDLDASSSSSTNTITSSTTTTSSMTLLPLQQQDTDNYKMILETRETQIIKLNKQNVELQEKNDNLMSELDRLKYDLNQLKNDDLPKKLQLDRDNLKKLNDQLQIDLQDKLKIIKDKEEQIEQLIQEGNKLSKQELNQSNVIKKLRAKEKENEELMNSLKAETKKQQKEIDELKEALNQREEADKQSFDAIKKLEKLVVNYEKELENAKTTIEDNEEKIHSLKNALDNSYKELAELHKSNAASQSKIMETQTSIESQLKEEIQTAVEKEKTLAKKKEDALRWELQSVRADIMRLEQQNALREDILRKEITDLQQQLRDSEVRNNELSQSISSATRPLLRQIENLQSTHTNQIQLLENAERNLIERLKDAQSQLCESNEKERHNSEMLSDALQKVKTYETQIQTLKYDKSRLNAEYETLKNKYEEYENEKLHKDAQNEILISSLNKQIESLTKDKKLLESQLEIEKEKTEADVKKLQNLILEYTKEKEFEQQKKINSSSSLISPLKLGTRQGESILTNDEATNSPTLFSKHTSVYEVLRGSSAINILDSLQSKLKEKDGEIMQLQKNINDLERIRESLAKELVNLSTKIENLENQAKLYPVLDERFNKLNSEYTALLQMYGEKEEECEELKMDLQDVKDMYKLQIEDLIKRTTV